MIFSIKQIFTLLAFPLFFNVTLAAQLTSDQPISKPNQENFMFLINSDPQMGDEHTKKRGLKILNELLELFVEETNGKKGTNKPDFVVWNGDLVWDAFQNAFDNFQRIVSKMSVPSVLVHGNHDGYNDDPKFLNLQKNLSGYQKLNYSFNYGKWHFIVISAEEKYLKPSEKIKMLDWLDAELKNNKDKQTMLFMHYHILPTGLSQMEFYTYFPMEFKNKMLDTIIRYNNVKYVFSGHVHIGIKASLKTARTYKGTNFILVPTPVFARPFGEEFPKFRQKGSKYDRRGFYLEVQVEGDQVKLIGKKIKHSYSVNYPKKFKSFTQSEDLRAFTPEGQLPINDEWVNADFNNGLEGWNSSFRYQKDGRPLFTNLVNNGTNLLNFTASYGSWTFDEYLENYQIIQYKDNMHMHVDFTTMPQKFKGSGGYFRVFAYDKAGKLLKILLFHWGSQENKVRFMPQSWAFNATGDRYGPLWLDKKIANGNMLSYKLPEMPLKKQTLDIELNQLLNQITTEQDITPIDHLAIAYGVWGRVNQKGRKFSSQLNVDALQITSDQLNEYSSAVLLNNQALIKTESELEYGYLYKKDKKKASSK